MERDRTKRLYDLHAWVGVISGLFVFVVSLSGVFSLFGEELKTWEDEALRIEIADRPAAAMPLMRAFVEEITSAGELLSLALQFPNRKEPYYVATARVRSLGEGGTSTVVRRWSGRTGEVLGDRGDGLSRWLVDFHRNLMLERTLGRGLVGISGVTLLLLILSGIVIHRKILRELFTWRLDRSVRLKWQDSHKAIGVWGLPFHIMIAFTGAWLGLIPVLFPVAAMLSFRGDQEAALAVLFGQGAAPAGVSAPMASIDTVRLEVVRQVGAEPSSLDIGNWGDANAVYTFFYRPAKTLLSVARVEASGTTGEITDLRMTREPGVTPRVLGAMTTLHYADFLGTWIKFVYVVLGLLLCIVTATGLMMWLERRLHGNAGSAPAGFYRALSRTTVGVCAGMALASVAIFYFDKLFPLMPQDRISAIGKCYFAVWAAALAYAFIRRNEYRACKELLAATGLAAAGLPVLNWMTSGQDTLDLLRSGLYPAAGVDIAGFVTGIVLVFASLCLPASRPLGRRV